LAISLISSGFTFPKQRAKIYFDPKGFSKLSISKTYRDLYVNHYFTNILQIDFKPLLKTLSKAGYVPVSLVLRKSYKSLTPLFELLSTSHRMIISEHLFYLCSSDTRLVANVYLCLMS
jgi:hypothetical protein